MAKPALDRGLLVQVLQDWTPPYQRLCLYYPRHRHLSASMRAFVSYLREQAQHFRTSVTAGSARLSKLGGDITETLEVVPRLWKVIQTVWEKFSCRACEKITQPPAPFHVTPRGFAGPNLLAMILFDKFAQHQPLNRLSESYAREGIDLSLSTLADRSVCVPQPSSHSIR